MLRTIFGVILGYITMAVLVFVTFTAIYLAIGADKAFEPGTYDPSVLWIVIMFAVGLGAGIAGGYVSATVARQMWAPKVLALLVLVLGLLFALPAALATKDKPNTRAGDVSNFDAMQEARTPTWVALLNPVVGVAGVLLGARLRGVPNKP